MSPSRETGPNGFDADVAVIGSGFGGSVAALRFAESGRRVLVLERGDVVDSATFEPDLDMFWIPERQRFGMNAFRFRGRNIVAWTGAAVGGGSHVYAGSLKRVVDFSGFPAAIAGDDMAAYYRRGEDMLAATEYPDYPPYSDVRCTELLLRAGGRLAGEEPGLVESAGRIRLGISFAPPGTEPGAVFTNRFGVEQRYADPRDQSILGGDIGSKNSLDRNYLAAASDLGARVEAMCEVDRLRPLPGGGWEIEADRWSREERLGPRLRRRWALRPERPSDRRERFTARHVVVAAGAVGSTELLLRNRDVHGTLDGISDRLGTRYTTNGDTLSLLLPADGLVLGWTGFALAALGARRRSPALMASGLAVHYAGMLRARRSYDPDLGPTNSDYVRFRAEDGTPQGVYIEGGRYPNPGRWAIGAALAAVGGYRPGRYRQIARVTSVGRQWIPPFNLLARTLPIPLLTMGRDAAVGRISLDASGEATIDIDLDRNDAYFAYTDRLARLVAGAAGARWLANPVLRHLRVVEVPHNLGGAPMGDDRSTGVVDHAGRVFGVDDLVVLDGSIVPRSLGPNPALTIVALAERALEHLVAQLDADGHLRAR